MTAPPGFALHPLAAQDITEVWEYIAADNPLAARRVREEIFGLSPATLRKWENGEREPARPTIFPTFSAGEKVDRDRRSHQPSRAG
jgi:plasmid stabilization system protein ParE